MLVPTLLTTVALAVSASAILLPPGVDIADDSNVWAQRTPNAQIAQPTLEIDCPGCGFPVESPKDVLTWNEDVQSALVLNFTLQNDKILLNDQLFHPIDFPHVGAFYAPLVRKSGPDSLPAKTDPLALGYAIDITPVAQDHQYRIVSLKFTVFDITGRQVHIPTVRVNASVDSNNGMIPLVVIDTIPVDAPGSPSAIGMDCDNSLCRVREMIIAKIREAIKKAKEAAAAAKEAVKNSKPAAWVKGCHNKFQGSGHPHHGGKHGGMAHGEGEQSHGHPHPHGHPHGHHGHHHSRLRAFFFRFIHQFIMPVILGVAAGMTAGALGMLIGHAIAFLWIKFARGGRRGPCSRLAVQEEAAETDEKEGLLAEGPPEYEELEGDTVKADEKE